MLHAYFDDSGTHDSSAICVVAGYFGSDKHWKRFDAGWRTVLDSYELEEFHANRFWSCVSGSKVPEFKGWDDAKCGALIRALLKVIGSHRIYPVGCAVDMHEWSLLTKDERAFLTGAAYDNDGNLMTPGAPNKTFFLPFLTAIASALDHCNPGLLVDFTFDESKRFAAYALNYFDEIKRLRDHNYKKMGKIQFCDSRKATPLQAADLLAYELYQFGIRRLETGKGSPTLTLVHATKKAKDAGAVPIFEKKAFESALRRFREARITKLDQPR